MTRKLGLIVLSTAWLAIGGCESDPGPAAQGMPRNESTGASGQRGTMEPLGQQSTQEPRDLAGEFDGADGAGSGQQPSSDYSAPQPQEGSPPQ